jgi:2-alkenal reductase
MKRTFVLMVILTLASFIAAGCALVPSPASIAAVQAQPTATLAPTVAPSGSRFAALADLEAAFERIYEQVNTSIVTIETVQSQTTTPPRSRTPVVPFPGPQLPPDQGLGSGFVWDAQGNIVTNNHVIAGADQITVTFADGTIVTGRVVGADPNSDLAVVKVDVPASQLHPVQMGDSTQIKVGQLAIAIGNPFGEQNTMTTGIISAVSRSLPVGNRLAMQGPTFTIPDIIQTDAPINPGNSGGVLLNVQGQVIGVTSAIESRSGTSSGIGFAIPSAIVRKVVPALITTGRFDHPYLGISGTTLIPPLSQAMGLKADQRGALVGTITDGGPAEKAGLRGSTQETTVNGIRVQVGGDVIVAMNGQPIKTFDDIVAYLARSTQVGQTVTLTVLRDGKPQDVQVTLAARPSSQTAQ